jgi:uncharacterized protein YeaO (DUF488 family)
MKHEIEIKRAYEPAGKADGFRVLVDRLWPRGISKENLHAQIWAKEIAPSTELRKWFGHDPERWPEFRERYKRELASTEAQHAIRDIIQAAKNTKTITLLYGAKDTEHNEAVVLCDIFQRLAEREA